MMTDITSIGIMTERGSTPLDGDPRSNGDDGSWWLQFRRGEVSLQDHPVYPSFVTVGKRAALYAAGGSLCGATYAYWWGRNVPHYATSLGANYGWLGLVFHGNSGVDELEKLLAGSWLIMYPQFTIFQNIAVEFAGAKYVGVEHGTLGTHIGAGFITGSFAGGAFGGPPTAVKGSILFACLGMGVYYARRSWNWQYEKWRRERLEELAGTREKNVYFEGWRKSDDKLPGQHFVGWRPENAAHNRSVYVGLKAGREAAQAREEALKTLNNGTDDESTSRSPSGLQDSTK